MVGILVLKMYRHFNKTYETYKCIGKGTYGEVYLVMRIDDGKYFAAKRFICTGYLQPFVLKEVSVLRRLEHKNDHITRVQDIIIEKSSRQRNIWVVMELGKYPLSKYLDKMSNKGKEIDEEEFNNILKAIYSGLHYLSQMGYAHLDLKPSNLILTMDRYVQLIDMGFARKKYRSTKYDLPPTCWYRPLELFFKGQHYRSNIDTWSLGCIMYECLAGESLVGSKTDQKTCTKLLAHFNLREKEREKMGIKPKYVKKNNLLEGKIAILARNDIESKFLSTCLNMNPETRPTIEQLGDIMGYKEPRIKEMDKNKFVFTKRTSQVKLVNAFKKYKCMISILEPSFEGMEILFLTIYFVKKYLEKVTLLIELEISTIYMMKMIAFSIVYGCEVNINEKVLIKNIVGINKRFGINCSITRESLIEEEYIICFYLDWDLDPVTVFSYVTCVPLHLRKQYLLIGLVISFDSGNLDCTEFEKAVVSYKIANKIKGKKEEKEETDMDNLIALEQIKKENINAIIDNFVDKMGMDGHPYTYFYQLVHDYAVKLGFWTEFSELIKISKDVFYSLKLK